jgi:molybdenum cofactor cytidylyltransferase
VIGAVILAAGESRRMGKPKPLLKIGDKMLIEMVLDAFRVVDDIIVVLGHEPERLIQVLQRLRVKWTVNPNYPEGMTSSFKEGLKKFEKFDAVFLALCDQPIVDRDFLAKAIDAWKAGAKIVSPVHNSKKGHPVLFDRNLFEEILALKNGELIRDVIHRHEKDHRLIEAGEWAVTDIDTPESLREFKERS